MAGVNPSLLGGKGARGWARRMSVGRCSGRTAVPEPVRGGRGGDLTWATAVAASRVIWPPLVVTGEGPGGRSEVGCRMMMPDRHTAAHLSAISSRDRMNGANGAEGVWWQRGLREAAVGDAGAAASMRK